MESLKVFGWAADHNGCGNYRIGLPMWALGLLGHHATAFSVLNVEIPTDLDVLVGQLVVTNDRTQVWAELARLPSRGFAMIYELDDDVWNLELTNPAHTHFQGELGDNARNNIAMADAVTVTTEHLAEVVSAHNPNVFVLPNCVDAVSLTHERPKPARTTVGWAGGSSHHSDFMSVSKDLRSFFRRNPGVDSHFMGTNYGPTVGRPDSRFSPWSNNLNDYYESIDFDIGIAPMAFHAFNRSKSDLRYLEYAALGIPVVASDFGPYSLSIRHQVNGMLVRHPHEWSKYLRQLIADDELRAEIGANAKLWAHTRTIQANIWRWEEVYRKVRGS